MIKNNSGLATSLSVQQSFYYFKPESINTPVSFAVDNAQGSRN
jgi:hypothetical protein